MVLSNKRKINKKGLKSKLTKKKRNVVRKTRKYVRKIKGGGWNYPGEMYELEEIEKIIKENTINNFTLDSSIDAQIELLKKDKPEINKYDDFIKLINDIITQLETKKNSKKSKKSKKNNTNLNIDTIVENLLIRRNKIENRKHSFIIRSIQSQEQTQYEEAQRKLENIKHARSKQNKEILLKFHKKEMINNTHYEKKYQDELKTLNYIYNNIENDPRFPIYIENWFLYFNNLKMRKHIYEIISLFYMSTNTTMPITVKSLENPYFTTLGFNNEMDYKEAVEANLQHNSKTFYNSIKATTNHYYENSNT
jgi:hypothetical protein